MYLGHLTTSDILLLVGRESLRAAAPFLAVFGGVALAWAVRKWPARALPPE